MLFVSATISLLKIFSISLLSICIISGLDFSAKYVNLHCYEKVWHCNLFHCDTEYYIRNNQKYFRMNRSIINAKGQICLKKLASWFNFNKRIVCMLL